MLITTALPISQTTCPCPMEDTNLKDMGLTLAAEIEESYMKNSDNALMYYYRVLSECSNSILADPVRLHLRKISKNRES